MLKSDEVELKGGMYTFMSLRLHTADLDVIDQCLAQKVHQAPGFFRDTPVVVDFSALEEDAELTIDSEQLLSRIREHRLLPIVASVANKTSQLASSIALPLIEGSAKRQSIGGGSSHGGAAEGSQASTADGASAPSLISGPGGRTRSPAASDEGVAADTAAPDADESSASLLAPTEVEFVIKAPLLVTKPVRSGQQIYARDTDLIVMGPVGPGAELVADNNIHVYGPLRGRALCGVSGNTRTRIFCQSLEAELVSVAGNFRLLENIPEDLRGKPAQIWLDKDRLAIEPL